MHARGKIRIDVSQGPLRRPSGTTPSPVSPTKCFNFNQVPSDEKENKSKQFPLNGIKEIHKDPHTINLETAVLQIHQSFPRPKPREVVDYLITFIQSSFDLQLVFELLCKSSFIDRHSNSLTGEIFNSLLDKQFPFDEEDFDGGDFLWSLLEELNYDLLRTLTHLKVPSKLEMGMTSLMCSLYRSVDVSVERKDTLYHFIEEVAKALWPFSASSNKSSILWKDDLFLLCFSDILKTIGKKLEIVCPRNMESTFMEIKRHIIYSMVHSISCTWLVELCELRSADWNAVQGEEYFREEYALLLPSILKKYLEEDVESGMSNSTGTCKLGKVNSNGGHVNIEKKLFRCSDSSGDTDFSSDNDESPALVQTGEVLVQEHERELQSVAAPTPAMDDDVFTVDEGFASSPLKESERFIEKNVSQSMASRDADEKCSLVDEGFVSVSGDVGVDTKEMSEATTENSKVDDWVEKGDIEVDSSTPPFSTSPSTGETRWRKTSDSAKYTISREVIKVPESCVGRLIGYKGCNIIQLQEESGAKVRVVKDDAEKDSRPATSGLTAHRLITGALGVDPSLSAEKLAEEEEKLHVAAEEKKGNVEAEIPWREVEISGTEESIKKAKEAIEELTSLPPWMNNSPVFEIPLKDPDLFIRTSGRRVSYLRKIENCPIYLKQEGGQCILQLFGELEQAKEAKKAVYESLYWPAIAHGYMVKFPSNLTEVIHSKEAKDLLLFEIADATNVKLQWMSGENGEYLFIRGYRELSMEAISYIAKINALFTHPEEEIFNKTWTETNDTNTEESNDVQIVQNIFANLHNLTDVKDHTENGLYSREFLLKCALLSDSQQRPADLDLAKNEEWMRHVVLPEGRSFDPTKFDARLRYHLQQQKSCSAV